METIKISMVEVNKSGGTVIGLGDINRNYYVADGGVFRDGTTYLITNNNGNERFELEKNFVTLKNPVWCEQCGQWNEEEDTRPAGYDYNKRVCTTCKGDE